MDLTVLLPLPATAGPHNRLWADWRALAHALVAGDRIIAATAGDKEALDRFTHEHGWHAAGIEILPLDASLTQADLEAAAVSEAAGPTLLLSPGDRIRPASLAGLRAALTGGADLVVINHMWQVAGPEAALACPDAPRWPMALGAPDPASAARYLLPDPTRLVPYAVPDPDAPETTYDARLATSARVALLAEPIVVRAPGPDRTRSLLARTPSEIDLHMHRLDDALADTDPATAHLTLEAAAAFLTRLPRTRRRRAIAHDGLAGRLLAALAKRDRGTALGLLATCAAARDRAVSQAVATQIAALRADLDLALPRPDYLRETYEWLRRP